jgi:hypothetical protein
LAAPSVSVREWTDVVRRARLGRTTKHIAWTLATFADFADGSRVYPGLATLAVAAEVDYKTAKRAVAALLAAGLIETVKAHPGVRNRGTEYRLILSDELLERVDVLSPAQFSKAAESTREANARRRGTGAPSPRTPGGQPVDNPVDNSEVQGTADPVLAEGVQGTAVPQPGRVRGTARPQYRERLSAITPIEQPTTTTSHKTADLRTAVTLVEDRAVQDPIPDDGEGRPPPLGEQCEHGLKSRRRSDGTPSCVLCRRGVPADGPLAEVTHIRARSA